MVACSNDFAWYRQRRAVGQKLPPEFSGDVVIEVVFGCPAVHNFHDIIGGDLPVALLYGPVTGIEAETSITSPNNPIVAAEGPPSGRSRPSLTSALVGRALSNASSKDAVGAVSSAGAVVVRHENLP